MHKHTLEPAAQAFADTTSHPLSADLLAFLQN
jgi:hypothetical protein